MINWNEVSRADRLTIRTIARRAHSLLLASNEDVALQEVEMDLMAAHIGCPLDLEKFKAADECNFVHDVLGIRRHLDRKTGELKDCFQPRCVTRTAIA